MASVVLGFRGHFLRYCQTRKQLSCAGEVVALGYLVDDATPQTADQLAPPLRY